MKKPHRSLLLLAALALTGGAQAQETFGFTAAGGTITDGIWSQTLTVNDIDLTMTISGFSSYLAGNNGPSADGSSAAWDVVRAGNNLGVQGGFTNEKANQTLSYTTEASAGAGNAGQEGLVVSFDKDVTLVNFFIGNRGGPDQATWSGTGVNIVSSTSGLNNFGNIAFASGEQLTLTSTGVGNGANSSGGNGFSLGGGGGFFTVTAVPEPSSVAMMLIGLGGLGYTMARRRR